MFVRNAPLAIALLLSVICPTFAAAEDEEFTHRGAFIGMGLGIAALTSGENREERTLNVRLGVDIVDYMSMEAEVDWIPDGDTLVTTFQERFSPLKGRWQPFALAGIGVMHVDSSDSRILGRFGAGCDFMFSNKLSASAQVSYLVVESVADFTIASLGLRLGF